MLRSNKGARCAASVAWLPDYCQKRDLTAQEKAVELMLFDLASCVQNDNKKPVPPAPIIS